MKIFLLLSLFVVSLPAFSQSELDTSQSTGGLAGFPIAFYTPETRWAIGAGGLSLSPSPNRSLKPTAVTLSAIYTQNSQIIIELTTNAMFGHGSLWHQGSFYYQRFPSTFYGIGNDTPENGKENYTGEIVRINPVLMTRLAPGLYGGGILHYESWSLLKTEAGKRLSPGTLPGSGSTTVTAFGLIFNYDERDNLFAPMRGKYYQASFIRSPQSLGSTFSFSRAKIDLREYFPLGNSHMLSAQLLFHTSSGTVPFRFLPQIGGQNVMRGYFEGRYRDKHMTAFQTEYRSPFYYRFGFVLFGSAGDVAEHLSSFQLRTMKFAYGAGIRFAFIPDDHINLRLDFGMTKHSNGMYITLNEAI